MNSDPSYLRQRAMEVASHKRSPGLSALLAFFFPALGALYTHRWVMAFFFVVLDVTFALLSFFGIGVVLLFLFRIVAALVCHSGAVSLNAMALEEAAERYSSAASASRDPGSVQLSAPTRVASLPQGPKPAGVAASSLVDSQEVRGVCNCCGQWFAEQTRRRSSFGRIWTNLLKDHNDTGICPACYNSYVGLQGFERDLRGDEWRPVALAAVGAARTIEDLQDVFRKYNELVPDLVEPLRTRSEEIKLEVQRATERASYRPCARCGDEFPANKLNYAEAGQLCDRCLQSMSAFG